MKENAAQSASLSSLEMSKIKKLKPRHSKTREDEKIICKDFSVGPFHDFGCNEISSFWLYIIHYRLV
jgi:hypothetical protein